MMRNFDELSEKELLALAISLEEEDERIYADFAQELRGNFPDSAAAFEEMRQEESGHRQRLQDLYQQKFGEHIPLIRRQDVRGFVTRRPVWLARPLRLKAARNEASSIEQETRRFYERAAARTSDASIRRLLDDLAQEERSHQNRAEDLNETERAKNATRYEKEAQKKLFLLQVVQPGLAGLMDGSVSTLAPVFAAAFATHTTHAAFLVGLAASIGAGISMGFAEALSDELCPFSPADSHWPSALPLRLSLWNSE
jgi:rubrerythrin